jgi:acetyltransferase-like isoleucine patch superfamily enzyme
MHNSLRLVLKHGKLQAEKAYMKQNRIMYQDISKFSGRWPKFMNHGTISLANNFSFRSFRSTIIFTTDIDGIIKLGRKFWINDSAMIFSRVSISIGSHSMIRDQVIHHVSPETLSAEKPVTIGRNVWISTRAMILPGVSMEDHAIIGAVFIVAKDTSAKCVAVGNSAKVVRTFNCPDQWIRP